MTYELVSAVSFRTWLHAPRNARYLSTLTTHNRSPLQSSWPEPVTYGRVYNDKGARQITMQEMEQKTLFHLLREKMYNDPGASASSLLTWYFQRVKESRTRLPSGSADNADSIALLIRYAARRQDISALRKLRFSAELWTKRSKRALSVHNHMPSPPSPTHFSSLTEQVDDTLFILAAKQNNWAAMHKLLCSRDTNKRWSSNMCDSLLQSKGALSMIQNHDVLFDEVFYSTNTSSLTESMSTDPFLVSSETHDMHEAKKAVWNTFLQEFGYYLREARQMSVSSGKPALPTWIVVSLLKVYSRLGKVRQVANLFNLCMELQLSKEDLPNDQRNKEGPPIVSLHQVQPPLFMWLFPPPSLLLSSLMEAYATEKAHISMISAFVKMTDITVKNMPMRLPDIPLINCHTAIEPDPKSILLVMKALANENSLCSDTILSGLSLLQNIENRWGTRPTYRNPQRRPLLFDLRIPQLLLEWSLEVNDLSLIRKVLRFQQGLLRRELRWHLKKQTAETCRSGQNAFAALKKWFVTIHKIYSRGLIYKEHANMLYGLALNNALFRKRLTRGNGRRQYHHGPKK